MSRRECVDSNEFPIWISVLGQTSEYQSFGIERVHHEMHPPQSSEGLAYPDSNDQSEAFSLDSLIKMDIDGEGDSDGALLSSSIVSSAKNKHLLIDITIPTLQNKSIFDLDNDLCLIPSDSVVAAEVSSHLGDTNTFLDTEDLPSLGQETNHVENEIPFPVFSGIVSSSSFLPSTNSATEMSNPHTSNGISPTPLDVLQGSLLNSQVELNINTDIEMENSHEALHHSSSNYAIEFLTASDFLFPPLNDSNNLLETCGLDDVERHNFDVRELFSLLGDNDLSNQWPRNKYYPTDEPHQATKICIDDLDHERCDFQGINWAGIGIYKDEARDVRLKTYQHHTNVGDSLEKKSMIAQMKNLPKFANYFRFGQMNRSFKTRQIHFQLRHMISATSKNAVFLACGDKIQCANPERDDQQCIMDFSKPCLDNDVRPMQMVSTLTADNDLVVAGGYEGEYAFKSLLVNAESPYTSGIITRDQNGSTNHVHTFLDRRSGLPQAVFANNDRHVRILDCNTNRFVGVHDIGWAVNCSATSPDSRLRLIIGDDTSPWVVEAETGTRIKKLPNHKDYGFACAWSQNGLHMATGNQDEIVQIWDARNWDKPIHILTTDMAGVRTLEFSPLGEGKPVLALAEPADFVSIVDAELFHERQRFDFFGEIGGIGFTPDGSKFFVANTDSKFGGLLEFDRLRSSRHYDGLPRVGRDHDAMGGWLVDKHDSEGGENSQDDEGFGQLGDRETCWVSPKGIRTGFFGSHRGLALDKLVI